MCVKGCAVRYCRDNEEAILTINGKRCWSKRLQHGRTSNICGAGYHDDINPMSCEADVAADGKMAVRVHSGLDSGSDDESIAIRRFEINKKN